MRRTKQGLWAVVTAVAVLMSVATPSSGQERPASADSVGSAAVGQTNGASFTLHLGRDGSVQGRLVSFLNNGGAQSGRIRLAFLQGGRLVKSASTTDSGAFQVGGLEPGAYSLVAKSAGGMSAFGISVTPAVASPGSGTPVLNVSFAPISDVAAFLQGQAGAAPEDETAPNQTADASSGVAPAASAAGGAAGGGGAGLGVLLGGMGAAMGAAGAASGGGGGGGGGGPASPSSP